MPPASRGIFITLEGGDGAGKSTQARILADRLCDLTYTVCLTREPTGTALGTRIWSAFADSTASITPVAELLFFSAARAQHMEEVIKPALARYEIVICDRFADSTIAYQGYGRGLPLDVVHICNDLATGALRPDLTLLFDLPPEAGTSRANDRGARADDSIGQESLDFHRRVRDGFLQIAREEPQRIAVIDAASIEDAVARAVWDRVEALLKAAR